MGSEGMGSAEEGWQPVDLVEADSEVAGLVAASFEQAARAAADQAVANSSPTHLYVEIK